MACEKWLWARVWGVWLRCVQQTGQCWAVSIPTRLCDIHLCVYTLCAVSQCPQFCKTCVSTGLLPFSSCPYLQQESWWPWAVKKVMWFNLPVGSILNHPKPEQHPGKGRRQSGRVRGHSTLQPSRDRQCETSWPEVAEKHSGSKCELPGTLCRECVRKTCSHASSWHPEL